MTETKKAPERSYRQYQSPVGVLFSLLKNYFFAIVGAAVLALVLRVYVLEAFRIPTDFMSPALLAGDHIFVNKLSYGGSFGLNPKMPSRGDIVILSFPNDPTKDYIKRIVAVGGDTIEIKGGVIELNHKVVGKVVDADLVEEQLDNHHYNVSWKGVPLESRKMVSVTVPKGQLFVMGDNRGKGQDSRSWGFLNPEYIKGKAVLVWFSASPEQSAADGAAGIRWSRLFKRIN